MFIMHIDTNRVKGIESQCWPARPARSPVREGGLRGHRRSRRDFNRRPLCRARRAPPREQHCIGLAAHRRPSASRIPAEQRAGQSGVQWTLASAPASCRTNEQAGDYPCYSRRGVDNSGLKPAPVSYAGSAAPQASSLRSARSSSAGRMWNMTRSVSRS
jgi:hypothetical protein